MVYNAIKIFLKKIGFRVVLSLVPGLTFPRRQNEENRIHHCICPQICRHKMLYEN